MEKRIIFMRHSETDFHKQKRVIGNTDIGLNATGIVLVNDELEKLANYDIELVVTSSLRRAIETGEIISNAFNIPIQVVENLHERGQGVLEGMLFSEVLEKYGKITAVSKIEGRERLKPFLDRISNAIECVCEENDSNVILIVAHSNVLRMFYQIHGIRIEKWTLCESREAYYYGKRSWKFGN